MQSFSSLDKNNDGMLGRMEAAADPDANSQFDRLDVNHDAKLSRSEYAAWDQASTMAAHPAGDTNVASNVVTSSTANAKSSGIDYSQSMKRLQQATEKLRDATQAMAQEPAGPARNRAIGQVHEALFEAQRSMIALPPDLRLGSASTPDYSNSMERLKEEAQKLREAAQAMAQQPAGERRNKAIDQARQALFDTNQAMIALPIDMRVAASTDVPVAGQ